MTIVCPYQDCQQQLEVEPHHAGSEANCPTCRRPMLLPELAAFPVEEIDPAPWAMEEVERAPAMEKVKEPGAEAVTRETTRVKRPDPANATPSAALTGPDPESEDLVPNLISRRASKLPSHLPLTPTPHREQLASPDPAPPKGRDAAPAPSGPDSDSDFSAAPATRSRGDGGPEEPFTPGGGAGCPKCSHAFDEAAQNFVQELVELREIGVDVGGIGVRCACGAETEFRNLLWIRSAATVEPHPASRETKKRPTFHPPNSRRDRAKIFSDAGFAAVKKGEMEKAQAKWLEATEADESWSVPFFNLARLSLDRGDRDAAARFLGMAEDRAQAGASDDDRQVIKQVPFLKSRLEAIA